MSQHEGLDFRHVRGGQALYLQEPLFTHKDKYLEGYARAVLTDGGEHAMVDAVEALAGQDGVATKAPLEFDDLRQSGHPTVTSNGRTVYDRAPRQHRLTPEELKAKSAARDALDKLTGGSWSRGEGHGEHGPVNVIHKGRAKP